MPLPTIRPSLTKDLETRYGVQHAGGTFDVKKVLGGVNTSPAAGTVIDAASLNGQKFQSPNGFQVKVMQGITQLVDAQSNPSKELSLYIKGLDTRRYRP